MLIYVSHPFAGTFRNYQKIRGIVNELSQAHPENAYICPVLLYKDLYYDEPYEIGINRCLEIEARCDAMILCDGYENSVGCRAEVRFAEKNNIPIVRYHEN